MVKKLYDCHRRSFTCLVLLLICVSLGTAQNIYKEGTVIKVLPYNYPGATTTLRDELQLVKNLTPTSSQEQGFWERGSKEIEYFAINYGPKWGNPAFENEKAQYPYAMSSLIYGLANGNTTMSTNALNTLQSNDPDPWNNVTDNVDYYAAFTIKGQMPKYFFFGKYNQNLSSTYQAKMISGANKWTYNLNDFNGNTGEAIDPMNRAHPYYKGPCSYENWTPECKNSWVDIRTTDNLKAMRESSIYLMAEEIGNETIRNVYKDKIKNHAATLYHVGYSEWDSENYFSHGIAPWTNLYSYAKDPAVKKLAKAALDWYMTAASAKYYRGMTAGASKRLTANGNIVFGDRVANVSHLYFGQTPQDGTIHDERDVYIQFLSAYRPPQAVYGLGSGDYEKYTEQVNTKPSYGVFTPDGINSPEVYETVFSGNYYKLGSAVSSGASSDVRAFKLANYNSTNGAEVFFVNTSSDGTLQHDKKSGDEISQYRNLVLYLRPASTAKFIFQTPNNVPYEAVNGVWFFKYEKSFLALRPININYEAATALTGTYVNHVLHTATQSVSSGYAGFGMEVGEEGQFSSYADFKTAVLAKSIDLSQLAAGTVTLNGTDGSFLKTTVNPANDLPILYRNSTDSYNWNDVNNFSTYKAITPPLVNLATATAIGSNVTLTGTASDPSRGAISQDWKSGTLRVISNGYVFTSTVTTNGDVTWSEEVANNNNTKGTLSVVEVYAGGVKVGEITDPVQLSTGNLSFTWSNVATGIYDVKFKAVDAEGNTTWSNSQTINVINGTQPPQDAVLTPIADAYVKDGTSSNTNFGSNTSLEIKLNAGARRDVFLKFDLSTVSGPITNAKLRMYGRLVNANTASVPTALYSVSNTSWEETTITYANKPTIGGTALGSVNVAGIIWTWYEWDVAAYLEQERAAGRSTVSFALINLTNSDPYAWFESRENTNKPQLSLTYTPSAGNEPGTGLQATYFSNADLTGTEITRTDAQVNFNWGSGAPDASMDPNTFSARWTGKVKAAFSETYTFYTRSDDGIRLWVNGVQLINNWTNHSATENSGTIALSAGEKYDIVLEYFDNTNAAVAELRWSSASTPKAFIPQVSLYSSEAQSGRIASRDKLAIEVVEQAIDETLSQAVTIHPNPVKETLHVDFNVEEVQEVEVEVITTTLQSITKRLHQAVPGANSVTIPVGAMADGIYLITLRSPTRTVVRKIIIKK